MLRLSALILLLPLLACGPAAPEGPHLLYSADAQSLDNPFPDARLASGEGAVFRPNWYRPFMARSALTGRMRAMLDTHAAAAAKNHWPISTFGGTLLRASAPLDPASLPGRVARLRAEPGGGYQVLEAKVATQHVRETLPDGMDPGAELPDFFLVRPGAPLLPGEDGLLVVLAGVKTADGALLERGREWAAQQPALAPIAAALGVPEAEVLLALPQKGGQVTRALEALGAWAKAHPPRVTIGAHGEETRGTTRMPAGLWTTADADWNSLSTWLERKSFGRPSANVGRVVFGDLHLRDLRVDGVFDAGREADPSTAPEVPVRFVLTLPTGPRPPGGFRVVMGQHGVAGRNSVVSGDSNSFCMEWAEVLASQGLGCLGIDATSHGLRGPFTAFFAVENLPALRDNFRQMAFDLLQVEQAVATLDIDADGTPDLNPTADYYGNSLGAIMGATYVPYADKLSSAVLNVGGGGLSNILVSKAISDLIGLLIVSKTDLIFDSPAYYATFPLFRVTAQPFLDAVDGVASAHRVPASRAVLLQEGLFDETIPNATTEDLARALGCEVVSRASTRTAPGHLLYRFDPDVSLSAAERPRYVGHNVVYDVAAVRTQMVQFLQSKGLEVTVP